MVFFDPQAARPQWLSGFVTREVQILCSTSGPGPAGGTLAIEKCYVAWGCLWFWQLKDPLGSIEKNRALHPCPGFLSWSNIAINVCEVAVKSDSINL